MNHKGGNEDNMVRGNAYMKERTLPLIISSAIVAHLDIFTDSHSKPL